MLYYKPTKGNCLLLICNLNGKKILNEFLKGLTISGSSGSLLMFLHGNFQLLFTKEQDAALLKH
ncbi:hypothetical protein MCRY_21690 [Marivita cryptomonadis]|nr:hypothetical protein MCRY_21690 [Marivita cryptomonadis]